MTTKQELVNVFTEKGLMTKEEANRVVEQAYDEFDAYGSEWAGMEEHLIPDEYK